MNQDDKLRRAIVSIQDGDKKGGGRILLDVLKADRDNELAWLWMSTCVDKVEDKQYCLKNVLRINPTNQSAQKALTNLPVEQTLLPEPTFEQIGIPTLEATGTSLAADVQLPGDEQRVIFPPVVQPPIPVANIPHIQPEQGSNSIGNVIVVLLVLLGIFWLIIAFIQVAMGLSGTEGATGILFTGGWNILMSILNLAFIHDVVKRYKHVVKNLLILGIVGAVWGGYQLVNGAWLQVCAVPLYIALAVLAQTNKNYFTELTEKEKQSAAK